MESHLLQMRGLKRLCESFSVSSTLSHLLQMRGLKHKWSNLRGAQHRRIFYRCVD